MGVKAALPGGDIASFGGKVMKNVAGYDAVKLFVGSRGTLGAVVEATLRVHSKPGAAQHSALAPEAQKSADPEASSLVKKAFDPLGILPTI
jgi:FAD/FMN-containing dehydrogenase